MGEHGAPPTHPTEEAMSALKAFFAQYMILRVGTVMHNNTQITYNSAERKGDRGGTDMAVSVAQACK